jgi:hypothetical protein
VKRRGTAAPSANALETSFMALSRAAGDIGSALAPQKRARPTLKDEADTIARERDRIAVV